jgi:hypothetical protein
VFRQAPNSLSLNTPICASSVNVTFPKITYVRLGGDEATPADLFGEIASYQYYLPSGVTPVSGLTPALGLPNYYNGNNNVNVSVDNPFLNYTLKVRALNTICSQALPGNLNDIVIQRPQLSISGVTSMRCGETDTKTFTIQNIPSSPNCITSYTWQIANKGWKYNGSIPTSDVVTSTPSIQLQSADNNAAPPQSFSVVVATSSANVTLNKTINYLAPTISIPIYSGDFGLNCNVTNVNAVLTNAPISSYNLLWSTVNGFYIDGAASPQSSGTLTTVSLEKVGSSASDLLTVSLQATCGTINSVGGYNYEGCLPWDDLSVDYFNSVPMKPDPLLVYCSTQDQLAGLLEFEWYWFNGSDYTFAVNSPGLSFWSDTWPCGMNSLYVRAKWYSGTSELKYVGDYDGYCVRLLTTPIKKDEIKIFPNPAANLIIVDYTPKNNIAVLRVLDLQGKLLMQNEIKNDANKARLFTKVDLSKLPRGRYLVAIQDGKNKYTRIIEKL